MKVNNPISTYENLIEWIEINFDWENNPFKNYLSKGYWEVLKDNGYVNPISDDEEISPVWEFFKKQPPQKLFKIKYELNKLL